MRARSRIWFILFTALALPLTLGACAALPGLDAALGRAPALADDWSEGLKRADCDTRSSGSLIRLYRNDPAEFRRWWAYCVGDRPDPAVADEVARALFGGNPPP